ncbi:MAG: hypothetical protein DRP87_07295 [Spirochaetes bacterium]|nr:MAG: hypothetical protein DRP87_07295 [Spirochaetota bacterium]
MKLNIIKAFFLLGAVIIGFVIFIPFPDYDIRLLGIGEHRNFLFHSSFLPVLGFVFLRKSRSRSYIFTIIQGFTMGICLAIGLHLFLDTFQSAAVKFIFIGSLVDGTSLDDRLWLGINSIVSMIIAFYFGSNIYKDTAAN